MVNDPRRPVERKPSQSDQLRDPTVATPTAAATTNTSAVAVAVPRPPAGSLPTVSRAQSDADPASVGIVKRRPFVFAPVALTAVTRRTMAAAGLQRMLQARVSEAGAAREQAALITRLLATAIDARGVAALMDYVCVNVAGRLDLLLVWLHRMHSQPNVLPLATPLDGANPPVTVKSEILDADQSVPMDAQHTEPSGSSTAVAVLAVEPIADGGAQSMEPSGSSTAVAVADGGSGPVSCDYEGCVGYVLQRLDALQDKLLPRIVLELPHLGLAFVRFVEQSCAQPDRAALGLATLRDVLLLRPASRDTALPLLLRLARSPEPTLRKNAIFVCVRLHSVSHRPVPS